MQSGYAQSNCFVGLATNKDSDDCTADTITGTINSHMANLTAQTTATLNEHSTQTNASFQQLAAINAQLYQQQQAIMNQMAMMSLGGAYQGAAAVVTLQQTAHFPQQIYLPPALPHHQQGYYNTPQQSGGRGRTAGQSCGRSRSGHRHARGRGSPQVPIPYVGGAQLVPYVQGVVQQGQCSPRKMYTNKIKWYANQNVCYMCCFDFKDWHTSAVIGTPLLTYGPYHSPPTRLQRPPR
jgi:hypothetical protein